YYVRTGNHWTLAHNNECTTPKDLIATGNRAGPRGARPSDFDVEDINDIVGPTPDFKGASAFESRETAERWISGQSHKLPAGSDVPDGLGVHYDNTPEGHWTVYPTRNMKLSEFNDLFKSMDWHYDGKLTRK
ncbi:hypothetical protein, partial [Propionibacterium acidifaciens]|uniref:hypothetical protein n=1 Tax=Propionibacterium acidifaciens TaxID=556499 RepID=UPI0028E54A0E